MKAFHFQNAQIGTISTRVDGGIGFRISTGEIPPDNLAQFFLLRSQNVSVLVQPLDGDSEPPVEVLGETEQKTMGQRVRGALYKLWEQLGKPADFEAFYRAKMQVFLDSIKAKLDN